MPDSTASQSLLPAFDYRPKPNQSQNKNAYIAKLERPNNIALVAILVVLSSSLHFLVPRPMTVPKRPDARAITATGLLIVQKTKSPKGVKTANRKASAFTTMVKAMTAVTAREKMKRARGQSERKYAILACPVSVGRIRPQPLGTDTRRQSRT